jgi:hypothetical protein
MPAPGDAMGFPASSKCVSCHQTIKKDSAAIQKLATFDRNKPEIPWVRVYKVPDFVFSVIRRIARRMPNAKTAMPRFGRPARQAIP